MAEPSTVLREGGVIATGYDAELDELRAIQTNCGEFLLALEARERERSGIANLKVEYNRVHGFYIEVSRAQADNVPDDYRRRQTLKNAERYITPELKAFEDKALSASERALAREKLLYEGVAGLSPAAHRRACRPSPLRWPNWTCWRRLAERAQALNLTAPGILRRSGDRDQRRTPPGGGKPDRELHPQRHPALPHAPDAAHHRPEHGRQIDLHAADRADRAAGPLRQLRAGAAARASARSTRFSPASARPTTWPAAAPPSWWK